MSKTIKIAVFVFLLADMMVVPSFAGPAALSDKTPTASEIKASIDKAPKAVFPEVIYNFAPVYEGVEITPSKGHPFTIKEVKAREGQNVHYKLKPLGRDPRVPGYELVVENSLQKAGDYRDMISIKTDSKEKPSIIIPVSVHIQNAAGK
jgi:hypothetical protein